MSTYELRFPNYLLEYNPYDYVFVGSLLLAVSILTAIAFLSYLVGTSD